MTKATEDTFKPVPFNPKATAAKVRAISPKFKKAYDALDDEFTALAALLKARKDAGLTQAEVASRMGVSQPVLARIESSLIKEDYSPSLKTLRRYAQACGKKLQIRLVDHTKPLSQR